MTDLTPVPELSPVPQLEVNTIALAGTGNPMNQQAQALLNRNQYLVDEAAGRVNVLRHGASVLLEDNTSQFIAADAEAASKGWTVYVPGVPSSPGFIVGNLTLTAPLTGSGKNSKITRLTGTSGDWLTIGNANAHVIGINADGVFIAGNGIEVNGFDDVVIYKNILTRIGGLSIHFNECDNLSIHDNKVTNCTNGITNVMPSGSLSAAISRGLSVKNNKIDQIAGTGIYLAGKQLDGDPNYHFTNNLVVDGEVSGNSIRNVAGHGIIGQSRRTTFANNVIISAGNSSGLQSMVIQGDMATVVGNVCEGGSGVGIDMGACTNSAVCGNTVRGKGEIGIELQSCKNTTCAGNTVESCGATVTGNNSAGIVISDGFFGPSFSTLAVVVSGNTVSPGPNPGKYGISVDNGAKECIVTGNYIAGAGSVGPLYVNSASKALVFGNVTGANESNNLVVYADEPNLVARNSTGNSNLVLTPQGTGRVQVASSDLAISAVGKGIRIKEGSNAKMGVSILVAGSVVVPNTSVTATSRIFLTGQQDGGTPGAVRVSARTVGASFTITSSSGTDTSTIGWNILEPS